MRERFAEPTEEQGRERRDLLHALDDPGERVRRHQSLRLVPHVADAGAAEQVAEGRRLHVHPGEACGRPADGERVGAFIEADGRAVDEPEPLGQLRGQDEVTLFVEPDPDRVRSHRDRGLATPWSGRGAVSTAVGEVSKVGISADYVSPGHDVSNCQMARTRRADRARIGGACLVAPIAWPFDGCVDDSTAGHGGH